MTGADLWTHSEKYSPKISPIEGKPKADFAFNPDDFDQLAEQAANFELYFINAKPIEMVSLPGYLQFVDVQDDNYTRL